MNENVKIFVGLLVPAATIVAFFFSVFLENYVLGVFLSIFGISSWLFFTFVMKSYWHQITGNVIIVFGALLALSVFLDAGIEQNMFGGLNFLSKVVAYSTILHACRVMENKTKKDQRVGRLVNELKRELSFSVN